MSFYGYILCMNDVREYLDSDYDTLQEWWVGHGWEPVPQMFLPRGFVVEGIAAAFVYVDSVAEASMMEWVVANPNEENKIAIYKAIKLLIEAVNDHAKARGAKFMFTSVKHDGLLKMYEKAGFMATDTGITNMIKGVK